MAIQSNYRCLHGEIDLIMRDGDCLVFIEVKYRSSGRFGSSVEQVGARKRGRLVKAALHFLAEHYPGATPACRFDVVGIEGSGHEHNIQWIPNAFES